MTACGPEADAPDAPTSETGSDDATSDESARPYDARKDTRTVVDADARVTGDAGDEAVLSGDADLPVDASEAGPSPALCLRLVDPKRSIHVYELSAAVRGAYITLVDGDCRVTDLLNAKMQTIVDWNNALYGWSVDLWGCRDKRPATFALIHQEVMDLTSADAAVLIELYLEACKQILELSPIETASLRKDIEPLAAMAITRPSGDYTFSACGRLDAGAGDVVSDRSDAPPVDGSPEAATPGADSFVDEPDASDGGAGGDGGDEDSAQLGEEG